MNIANLTPAERMKAFGLVGLIIVALFFAVHTILGAVAPKKTATPNNATAAGVPGPPPPLGGGAADTATGPQPKPGEDPFPLDKVIDTSKKHAELERAVPDPFVQIREPENHLGKPAGGPARNDRPDVEIRPEGERFGKALPSFGSGAGLAGGGGPAALDVKPIEPEIKVIGIVNGDSPVATISVAGAIQIARPGDPLAKGYRLMQITEEGVTIKHGLDLMSLRVGSAVNTPAGK